MENWRDGKGHVSVYLMSLSLISLTTCGLHLPRPSITQELLVPQTSNAGGLQSN